MRERERLKKREVMYGAASGREDRREKMATVKTENKNSANARSQSNGEMRE